MQPKPWERQPGESSPAWEARKLYIQMGPGRTIDRVSQELAKSIPLLKRWSARWNWVSSAEYHDTYIDKMASDAHAKRLIEESRAISEKWTRRNIEQNEASYVLFINSYNAFVGYEKDVKDGKRKANPRERAELLRSVVVLDGIAREARAEMSRLLAANGTQGGANAERPADNVPGRTLAVLKAFVDYREA